MRMRGLLQPSNLGSWEKNNIAEMLNRNKSAFLLFFPQSFGESRASWKRALFLG